MKPDLKLLHSLPSGNAGSLLSRVGEALQVRNPYEALQGNPIAITQARVAQTAAMLAV